ncbi:MAG: hypothetical protein PWP15_1597 [Methanothermococcus sp.]|nr:hypothetical protein [Methanothermococcus sp.]
MHKTITRDQNKFTQNIGLDPDIEKAGRLLGFKPEMRFEKGIEEFVKWIR